MQVNFRQGLISYQSLPSYLQLTKNKTVILDTSKKQITVNFANGEANYLYTEPVSNTPVAAWGPFDLSGSYWLYWDISLVTGRRTFGYTTSAPVFGATFPSSPTINEHFFNTSTMKMYYWNEQGWIECIRVFAGSLESGKIITISLGTQVNNNMKGVAGNILFDIYGKPLKRFTNDGSFEFLTQADVIQPPNTNFDSIKIGQLDISAIASTDIPKYYCVSSTGVNADGIPTIKKASYFDINNEAYAITSVQMNQGDHRQLIHYGFVQDPTWYWDYPPLTPLFVGGDGEISLFVNNPYSSQKIGYVVNLNTIFINFERQILKTTDSPYVTPTPTPSTTVTPTPTVTNTPTMTSTLTPTPTLTVTPSVTPSTSVTPTPTPSTTGTVTPTVTSSPVITPTLTPTPTMTPSGN